jgi:hypothetical protein
VGRVTQGALASGAVIACVLAGGATECPRHQEQQQPDDDAPRQ